MLLTVSLQQKILLISLQYPRNATTMDHQTLIVLQTVLLPERTLSPRDLEGLLPMAPSLFVACLMLDNRSAATRIHTRATQGSPY